MNTHKTEHKMEYNEFISSRDDMAGATGIVGVEISSMLFPFQNDIVKWALKRGRAAIFADCGLGKTPMQLEWARIVSSETQRPVIIFAPLAVSAQTKLEGDKFGILVNVCRTKNDLKSGINITNYEMMSHFSPELFSGIVVDESSILKSYSGKIRTDIIEFASNIEYRLACTATPSPNDITEICNHAEFIGLMSESEVKALYFTQDGNTTVKWRLKGHARTPFYKWLATWSVAMRSPSDLGYSDDGYVLPGISIDLSEVGSGWVPNGQLFESDAITLDEQRHARRESIDERVEKAAELAKNGEPWIFWCDLNEESEKLRKAIDGSVSVAGSDSSQDKEDRMIGFSNGKYRVLITKPSIAGFGMNWQHCNNMAFVGISHSYEQMYQAIRRCWRFGQNKPVSVHLITSRANRRVLENVKRKETQAKLMMDQIVSHMKDYSTSEIRGSKREEAVYSTDVIKGETWTAHLGDCVDVTNELDDNSIALSVFSPPFPGMYVYSNSKRDMGNASAISEMIEHFRFLAAPLLEKTMPGRSCAIHLTQIPAKKMVDGYIGIKDFRGETIKMFEEEGWIYYGEITIDKNPQVKAIRTRDSGLQFKSLATDSARMHVALADYILQFKKPGDNPTAIKAGISSKYKNPGGWITQEEWIRWARPVWYGADFAPNGDGISETDVLNVRQARDTDDERHLAPLQLGVIERCIKLWSAPGETIFSPFMGIGSEGYIATQLLRKFIGSELKESYFKSAIQNIKRADAEMKSRTLFAE
jgi:DNA modification methylase